MHVGAGFDGDLRLLRHITDARLPDPVGDQVAWPENSPFLMTSGLGEIVPRLATSWIRMSWLAAPVRRKA